MRYLCPICKKEYKEEEKVAKCFLKCWKDTHGEVKSKNAPRSEDKITRQCGSEVFDFFEKIQRGN